MLHIQLLGEFQLTDNDAVSTALHQTRLQSLLAYLLLHRHAPQSRQHLAFLFWPDSTERQAQTNLRKALVHLRRFAPVFDQALYADHKVLQWQPTLPFSLDVVEFAEKLAQATVAENMGQPAEAIALLTAAADLYRGPLLPNCYDDWVITERERLQQLCLNVLTKLTVLHEVQHDFAAALRAAQQLLRLDPLHEGTYTQLMRLYAVQGDHASALRTYHTCATVLARELGVEPGYATQAAYARLLAYETPTPPLLSATSRVPGGRAARLVGRQAEWAQLQTAWRSATEQRAHFVLIAGEAGIGKTHLAEELLHWASQQGFNVAQAQTYAGEGRLAYAPVVEWLRAAALRAARKDLPTPWRSELARLLPEILTEQPEVTPPVPMTEVGQRQRLFEALAQALGVVPQPLFLLIDDLQWCDSETLEWLHYLLHFAAHARLLVVGTVRVEEVDEAHPLQALRRHLHRAEQLTEILLGPLDAEQTASLATQVAQRPLDAQAMANLYQATEGNPLFIVEAMRSTMSEGVGEIRSRDEQHAPPPLPSKVQAVIQHRLAQLSAGARELAAVAAVIGRSFTVPLLAQTSGMAEEALVRGLDELWQRRIVREQGVNAYDFSHDCIREVAYATISPARRRWWHRQVAEALKKLYADRLDDWCSQLANHYEQAGNTVQAITYYQRAASVASHLFAYSETIVHLYKLLGLIATLPATTTYNEQKLDAYLLLGSMLIMAKGFAAPEVEEIYRQAKVLCSLNNSIQKRHLVLSGLRIYWGQKCQWQITAELEEEMLLLAQQTQNPAHLQHALCDIGISLFHQGKFNEAHDYFQRVIALHDMQDDPAYLSDYSHEPSGAYLSRLAATLALLGYANQAQIRINEALAWTHRIGRPFERLVTLEFAIYLAHDQHRLQEIQALIEEHSTLVNRYLFPEYVASSKIIRGWLLMQTGEVSTGIPLLQEGLAVWEQMGILQFLPYMRTWLIEAYRYANQFEAGLTLVSETLALVEKTGDVFWRAELHRLKGELLLAQGSVTSEVEACFQEAIAIARRQAAKSLELRATISLARLWQQQRRSAEARRQLAEIYAWFTEGFATVDLQEARLLLDQLSR